MADYSKDSDLALYEKDYQAANIEYAPYHADATNEINRRLRAQGLTTDQIAALTSQTLADLVGPACEWVMYRVYSSIGAHEAAKRHYDAFVERFSQTAIDVDENGDGNTDVHIGGGEILLA